MTTIPIQLQVDTAALRSTLQEVRGFSAQVRREQQTLGQEMSGSMRKAFQEMAAHGKSFGEAMRGMWQQLGGVFTNMALTMVRDWITAGVEKRSFSIAENLREITRTAATAAAHAWNAVVGIPIVGPALAPAAAAATFAGVEAFGALASARGGWEIVPQDQLALVHKNEMVLPAGLAERVREMASGGGGGEIHIHTGGNSFSATDAAGMERLMRQHEKAIVRTIHRLARNGSLKVG